jgi:hypothetical protein
MLRRLRMLLILGLAVSAVALMCSDASAKPPKSALANLKVFPWCTSVAITSYDPYGKPYGPAFREDFEDTTVAWPDSPLNHMLPYGCTRAVCLRHAWCISELKHYWVSGEGVKEAPTKLIYGCVRQICTERRFFFR